MQGQHEKRFLGSLRASRAIKNPEEWGFRWIPLGSSGAEKLLAKLYLNDELTDVKIYCEDKIFNCHKLILGEKSKVFKNMLFNNEMVEATSGEIKIVDTPTDAMENLLYYIYHDCLKSIAMITPDLLLAADKYDIPDLVKMCADLMDDSNSNCLRIEDLPRELLVKIMSYLNMSEKINVFSMVNKQWFDIANKEIEDLLIK